ncbi:MAG: hypothetical protein ACREOU_12570 [Candidatus Eiseniibacteriota bacterium]
MRTNDTRAASPIPTPNPEEPPPVPVSWGALYALVVVELVLVILLCGWLSRLHR